MKTRLPKIDSATGRGLKTTAFSAVSAFVIFSTGLLSVIQGVPGCSEAVVSYIQTNALQLALLMGIPAGIFSFVWNMVMRQDEKAY